MPIVLFCRSCLKLITTDDIQYDEPFTSCPHGCGHGFAEYEKRCRSHYDAFEASRDPSICVSCGKNHPNPSARCFFKFFYEEYCRTEPKKWDRKEKKFAGIIECVKAPPREYVEWLWERFQDNSADDEDKFAIFLIDAYENGCEPEMVRVSKEVLRNYACGRRSQTSIKRPPGRWKPSISPRSN